jgi:hypothetical protein
MKKIPAKEEAQTDQENNFESKLTHQHFEEELNQMDQARNLDIVNLDSNNTVEIVKKVYNDQISLINEDALKKKSYLNAKSNKQSKSTRLLIP